jgi:hypothetical protein
MRLPTGSWKDFMKALDEAQPRWCKIYIGVIGLPAWLYLGYRAATANLLEPDTLDYVAVVAFASSSVIQMAVFFRAFWRHDV